MCPVLLPPWFSGERLPWGTAFQTPQLTDTFLAWTGTSSHHSSVCPPDTPPGGASLLSWSPCRAGVHKARAALGAGAGADLERLRVQATLQTPQPRSGWTRLAPSLSGRTQARPPGRGAAITEPPKFLRSDFGVSCCRLSSLLPAPREGAGERWLPRQRSPRARPLCLASLSTPDTWAVSPSLTQASD